MVRDAKIAYDAHCRRDRFGEPVVIAGTGLVVGLSAWLGRGPGWALLPLTVWSYGLLGLASADLRRHRLPTRMIHVTGLVTVASLFVTSAATDSPDRLAAAVLCAASAFVVFGGLWLASPKSLGFGDVRLAALCALMLGWFSPTAAIVGLMAGQLSCLSVVAALAVAKRINRQTEIPLGAFLAVASVATALALGR